MFPNGLDINDPAYSGHDTWSNQRWAWEFLRRNSDFQKACDRIESITGTKRVAARKALINKFGLRKYIHYKEHYCSPEDAKRIDAENNANIEVEDYERHRAVEFKAESVQILSNMTKRTKNKSIAHHPRYAYVRIDLHIAAKSPSTFASQLDDAKTKLSDLIGKVKIDRSIEVIGDVQANTFITHLRIVDAESIKGETIDGLKCTKGVLYKIILKGESIEYCRKFPSTVKKDANTYGSRLLTALKIRDGGYNSIAAR